MKDRLFKVRIYLISTVVHAKFVFGKCWANDVISRAKHIIAYTTYYLLVRTTYFLVPTT